MTGDKPDGRHLAALRELVVQCAENVSADPLSADILTAVRDLIGCDEVLVGRFNGSKKRLSCDQSSELGVTKRPGSTYDDPVEQLLFELVPAENLCPIPQDVPTVTKISDFLSLRQWHASREYVEVQKRDGEHRLTMTIPDGPQGKLMLVCWRGPGKDFQEEDRWDLMLLMPHLQAAYRRGELRRSRPALTPRQRELLQLVSEGWTNYQIGRRLGLSEGTIRTHLVNIYARLGVRSRTEAVTRVLLSYPEPVATPVRVPALR